MALPPLSLPLLALAAIALPAQPAQAARRIYSYDPANAAARVLAEDGFTFVFDDAPLRGQKVRTVLSNHANAEAPLQPASEDALGATLEALAGKPVRERELYEIVKKENGDALARAACPGAERAWLAFGPLKRARDLAIQVFGRDPGGKPRFCATLQFTWRGEWRLPDTVGSMRPDLGPRPQ
ncbi:MAG TPA: hypothetical protein VF559_03245 [Caulobacteraceae bacterium]|jgi:hypothetical protein